MELTFLILQIMCCIYATVCFGENDNTTGVMFALASIVFMLLVISN